MTLTLGPGRVEGRLAAPPSKSHTHRAFILAALSGNGSIRGALESDDTTATREGLGRLGFLSSALPHETRIGGTFRASRDPIEAHESGTTLRLLSAFAAIPGFETRFVGAPALAKRPIGPLLASLRALGATVAGTVLPFSVRGPLQGGRTRLPEDASSQFLSALLLACPVAPRETRIDLPGPIKSRPYVDITLHQLRHHGVEVQEDESGFTIRGAQRVRQKPYEVPGDYSSAAFLLAAAAVTRGDVTITNLPQDDPQGDRAIVEQLRRFGAQMDQRSDSVRARGGDLEATTLDVGATPDLFPILCVVGALSKGTTRLQGARHLRQKESDRILSMARNLEKAGIGCRELPDGIEIEGGTPRGVAIQSFGDHRIAMAMSVLALRSEGTSTLEDEAVVAKSYPGFFMDLKRVVAEDVHA